MSQELIMSTIKKVYAIRESSEKHTAEQLTVPVIGYVAVALTGIKLSRDQVKNVSAFVTASCNTGEKLGIMDKISEFKTKNPLSRPPRIWLAYAGLLLPIILALAVEAVLYYSGMLKNPLLLGAAAVLVIVALAVGVLLYGFLSYDPEYRRDVIEREIWKTIRQECQKRIKQGIKTRKQLPPAPPSSAEPPKPVPAPIMRAPGPIKKL